MPVVLITGASQGIGEAEALAFARESDVRLSLVARNVEKLEDVARRCRALGAEATVFPCDVTDEAAVTAMAGRVLAQYGVPDVLVNNAGTFRPATFRETSPSDFREQIEVNLTSGFLVTRAFLDGFVARGSGHIFFTGSVASIRAYPSGVAYNAAKHAVLGLARSLREELKPRGIRVTCVLPGATYTESWFGTDLPESRFIASEDVAEAVLSIYRLSPRTVVEEILLRPQLGDV